MTNRSNDSEQLILVYCNPRYLSYVKMALQDKVTKLSPVNHGTMLLEIKAVNSKIRSAIR